MRTTGAASTATTASRRIEAWAGWGFSKRLSVRWPDTVAPAVRSSTRAPLTRVGEGMARRRLVRPDSAHPPGGVAAGAPDRCRVRTHAMTNRGSGWATNNRSPRLLSARSGPRCNRARPRLMCRPRARRSPPPTGQVANQATKEALIALARGHGWRRRRHRQPRHLTCLLRGPHGCRMRHAAHEMDAARVPNSLSTSFSSRAVSSSHSFFAPTLFPESRRLDAFVPRLYRKPRIPCACWRNCGMEWRVGGRFGSL